MRIRRLLGILAAVALIVTAAASPASAGSGPAVASAAAAVPANRDDPALSPSR